MIPRVGGTVKVREPSERRAWRRGWWLAAALTVTATFLTACGDDGGAEGGRAGSVAPKAENSRTSPSEGSREPILIRTRVTLFVGDVLEGSVIGDAPFCPGGTVRHEPGSPTIGFPAINVFHCPDGQLQIGFGPGPDQMDNRVQTSDWAILEGSGRFEGMSGDGQMRVRFEKAGSSKGWESFRGLVVVP